MVLSESLSGVRGRWGRDLTPNYIRTYLVEYESMLREKKKGIPYVVRGYDTRPSSELIDSVIGDSLECRVMDIGVSTTPIIENTVRMENADGGIIITASHNPEEDNGLKFLRSDGALLDPNDMGKLIKRVHCAAPIDTYVNFIFGLLGDEALDRIQDYYGKGKGRKIILDPNGGSACAVLKNILGRLNIEAEIINGKEGEFGREIEPNKKSLSSLAVKLSKNDIAFGFDCDADRSEVVVNDGSNCAKEFDNIINGQYLLGVITDYFLAKLGKNAEGRYVVANDATSYLVKEITERYKARFVEVGTGEVNVVNKMLELNAVLAGEGSSSGFIHPATRCRDGILTMLYVLAITAERGKSLGEIIDSEIPKYHTLRDDGQKCNANDAERVRKYIRGYYKNKGYRISEPDQFSGIKAIDNEGNWVWFRASATSLGQFRIFADSKDKERAETLLKEGVTVFYEAKMRG